MSKLMRVLSLGACVMLLATTAYAGGSDEYEPEADEGHKGPVYYGFVRDHRGSSVAGAQVMLKPKQGEAITLKSNTLGLYRSHVNAMPDDVEISCEKEGYKQVRVARRNAAGSRDAMVETNCTMQRL